MDENFPPSERNKPILDDANGVVRLVREQPPEHCILKVNSFSLLQRVVSKSTRKNFESTEFKAGGHTWVLSVYPEGNEEDGVGHLSLYVAMVDKLSSDTFVNVTLRFFIYDQIRDNYMSILGLGLSLNLHSCFTFEIYVTFSKLLLHSFRNNGNGFLKWMFQQCVLF
ncbi:uncharacterized protein [Spinacia oleracea]|uniref:MATH domain-containing protein n=1 Tax=Spinacia oleracea TaxID=3562 RepID=A0A9R0IPV9_SPIOL|nr:uncharacterized protein LOC110792846 [Spinacia oleracea]